MNFIQKHFVDVKRGTKVTYSESDLRKLDRTYEKDVLDNQDRRVRSPMRKVIQQAYLTQLRDYAYEKILDSHMYTFSHILVVPNPYDIVKQSALLLFNSSRETKIRYRVLGDIPATDFVGETDFTTRHRVPVMGLYLKRSNRVELEMINRAGEVIKRRMLRIYVSESPRKISNVLGENIQSENYQVSHFPFLLINGISFNPLAVDCEGKIRYSIQLRTSSIGMIPLADGHFLYEDRTANRMSNRGKIISCRYHEMDYMGRVYRTYLLDYPLCSVVAQNGNSLYVVTWSDDAHIRDCIIELDRRNCEVRKKIDLTQILGDKYRTKTDWAHISKISCRGDRLLVVLRRLHTIFEYDWKREELIWVLAPEKIWMDTQVCSYLLKGDQPGEKVCWRPDFASYLESENTVLEKKETEVQVALFQMKTNTDLRLFPKGAKDSSFVYLRINVEEKSFCTVSENSWAKCRLHGSGFFSKDKKGILLCSGVCKNAQNGRGKIAEVDYETGKELRTLYMRKGVNTIWEFEPDICGYGKVVPMSKQVIFGTVTPPEIFTGELPGIRQERIPKECFSGSRICEELYICNILPGAISRIYFIGENHAYVQDYSSMEEGRVKFPFAITMHEFEKDTYHVYVEFEGEVYGLKNEIRILK